MYRAPLVALIAAAALSVEPKGKVVKVGGLWLVVKPSGAPVR
jgi:hypothetical protein